MMKDEQNVFEGFQVDYDKVAKLMKKLA